MAQPHYASASLYVGDLAPDVNETTLYDIFSSVGPVASVRVCREYGTRRSLGYAYVNYNSLADAQKCLDTLNYTPIKGVPCRIMWSHRDPCLRRSSAGNIFVKNLDKVIDAKALHDTFSLFGTILSCKVARDEAGRSRGYGFVHYELEQSANLAIERINGMMIGTKRVFVGPFKKQNERPTSRIPYFTNLYVKHLPEEWTEETLRNLFSEFGTIRSMILSNDAKKRRFCLVNFEEGSSAEKAVEELHGRKVNATGVEPPDEEYRRILAISKAMGEENDALNEDQETSKSHFGDEIDKQMNSLEMLEDCLQSSLKERTQKEEQSSDTTAQTEKNDNSSSNKIDESSLPAAKRTDHPDADTEDAGSTTGKNTMQAETFGAKKETIECGKSGDTCTEASKADHAGDSDELKIEDDTPDKQTPSTKLQLKTDKSADENALTENEPNDGTSNNQNKVMRASSVDVSIQPLNESLPEDRLYVQRAMSKAERTALLKESFRTSNVQTPKDQKITAANLYVKNLDDKVTDGMLREAFAPFGTVLSCKIMHNPNGASRGFGFVSFAFPEEATKAVTAMHLKLFHGKPLYVGLAENRQSRMARLQQRYRVSQSSLPFGGYLAPNARTNSNIAQMNSAHTHAAGNPPPQVHSQMVMLGRQANTASSVQGPAPNMQHLMYASNVSNSASQASMYYSQAPPANARADRSASHDYTSSGAPGAAYSAPNWRQRGQISSTAASGYPLLFNYDSAAMQAAANPSMRQHARPTMPMPATQMQSMNSQASIMQNNQCMRRMPSSQMHAQSATASSSVPDAGSVQLPAQQKNMHFPSQQRDRSSYNMPVQQPVNVHTLPSHFAQDAVTGGGHIPSDMHPRVQKQFLGERLFPLVYKHQPLLAGKITGMMLEMDNLELLSLLESEALLSAKVEEALHVLERHHQGANLPVAPTKAMPQQAPASIIQQ